MQIFSCKSQELGVYAPGMTQSEVSDVDRKASYVDKSGKQLRLFTRDPHADFNDSRRQSLVTWRSRSLALWVVITAGPDPVSVDLVKAFFAENVSWELLRGNTAGAIFAAEEICVGVLAAGILVKRA